LIDKGANVNFVKDNTYLTPLHWAAFNDDPAVILHLLERGAEINFSSNDETPLDIGGLCDNHDVRMSISNLG
jgi:ankyrin repeat protein